MAEGQRHSAHLHRNARAACVDGLAQESGGVCGVAVPLGQLSCKTSRGLSYATMQGILRLRICSRFAKRYSAPDGTATEWASTERSRNPDFPLARISLPRCAPAYPRQTCALPARASAS